MKNKDSDVPVFVLCGGLGTRLREETEIRPKPMVPVGNRPILWHIMRTYSHHGFRRFILCLGYKAEVIKSYFLNYASMNSDFTVELKTNDLKIHSIDHEEDWRVTLAYTGELTMTGARVSRRRSTRGGARGGAGERVRRPGSSALALGPDRDAASDTAAWKAPSPSE